MRLIDADARVTVQSFDEEHEEYVHTEMSVEEALDFATDEGCPPVVEAEPVRHGHWIELWTGYKCSECARVLIIAPIAPFGNYCPYCGAKMDGDEE